MLSRLALTDFFSEKTHVVSFGKKYFSQIQPLAPGKHRDDPDPTDSEKTITLPKTNVAPENGGFQ